MFESLEAFIADTKPTRLSHPLLEPSTATSMYAAESRVFVHTEGTASHVLEVLTDHRAVGRQTPTLQLVEDLEGLGILSIIPGSSNRLAVVADSGDGYLFSKGAKRPELLDLGEATVRMLGLGSEFEAVVTEDSLWVRGESKSRRVLHTDFRRLRPARHTRKGRRVRPSYLRRSQAHRPNSFSQMVYPIDDRWIMHHKKEPVPLRHASSMI